MKDLVVLVADQDMEFTLKGLLSRRESLGINKITCDIWPHVNHDAGVYKGAAGFLQPYANVFSKALVIFDRHGCGDEDSTTESISSTVQSKLDAAGWKGRARVIVIDPELESWVWSDSPHVATCLGWQASELWQWLIKKGYLKEGMLKPRTPKDAYLEATRVKDIKRSSSLYKKLAEKVSLDRCIDPSFVLLRTTLQQWFGTNTHANA